MIDQLPTNRNDDGYFKDQRKIRANSFYMILPFISKLKHWIMNERSAMVGNKKKPSGQRAGTKKNKVLCPSSPFFLNNVDQRKQRHRSVGDVVDVFSSPSMNSNFYLKLQNNSSTPISSSPFAQSTASAFRPTHGDNSNKQGKYNKKTKSNGKAFVSSHNQFPSSHNANQDQFKRKLFTDPKENVRPFVVVKPFSMEMPECWKNFKFDQQKLLGCI